MLPDGSPEADIHPDLATTDEAVVITKTRFGSFSTTNLATHLHGRGLDTIVLGGVTTSDVILSTLRDAADQDFALHVLSDCCADPHPDVHRVLIDHVFPHQADVIDTEVLAALSQAS